MGSSEVQRFIDKDVIPSVQALFLPLQVQEPCLRPLLKGTIYWLVSHVLPQEAATALSLTIVPWSPFLASAVS